MRTSRCHFKNCYNTFPVNNKKGGLRRLCDFHRLNPRVKPKVLTRAQRKRKRDYAKEHRKKNEWLIRDYNREWMRRKRAGLPTDGLMREMRERQLTKQV